MVAETLHAYGISTADGLELLVHIGINTVELNGEGFSPKVKEGDQVKAGQLLCEIDMKLMKEKGYPTHTPILMTNAMSAPTSSCSRMKMSGQEKQPLLLTGSNIISHKISVRRKLLCPRNHLLLPLPEEAAPLHQESH